MLTNKDIEVLKVIVAERIKADEINQIQSEMWVKVEALKKSDDEDKWEKIQEVKQKYRNDIRLMGV